jgi:hypothetical protein
MTMIVDLATHSEKHVTVAELAAYWRVSERSGSLLRDERRVCRLLVSGDLIRIQDGRRAAHSAETGSTSSPARSPLQTEFISRK